jgi:nucleoside-diphosphate-sugar epimerase
VAGAAQIVIAIGFAYDRAVWRKSWVPAMRNIVDAASRSNTRVVFVDNLYQLGPQSAPRTEDMPLSEAGAKPAILAEVTRIWQEAARTGRVRFAALRCTDFYGPGVPVSHLGSSAFGPLAKGGRAFLLAPPDTPHDFAYVPDIARAVLTLLDAPDDAYGQAWNMPCAPTRTPREILTLGAKALGVKPKLLAIPLALLPLLGRFVPFMREVADVGFTWDRPYIVDGSKFRRRFGFETTPYEVGAPATALSFR